MNRLFTFLLAVVTVAVLFRSLIGLYTAHETKVANYKLQIEELKE